MRMNNKRERLVRAARTLIHRQGFKKTTLAHIAREADVPLGNVYYYFKTKDEIAAEAIKSRKTGLEALARKWEERNPDPRQRLLAFLSMTGDMRFLIAKYGCPVGSLCQELDKDRTELSARANETLEWLIKWAGMQFRLLDKEDASILGLELITSLQGASLVAHAFNDPEVLNRQIQRSRAWLKKI